MGSLKKNKGSSKSKLFRTSKQNKRRNRFEEKRKLSHFSISNIRDDIKSLSKRKIISNREDEDCIIVEPQNEILEIHNIDDDKNKFKISSRRAKTSLFYEDVMPGSLIQSPTIPIYETIKLNGLKDVIGSKKIGTTATEMGTVNTTTKLEVKKDNVNNPDSALKTNENIIGEESNINDDSVIFIGEEILVDSHEPKREKISSCSTVKFTSLINDRIDKISSSRKKSSRKTLSRPKMSKNDKTSNTLLRKHCKILSVYNNNAFNPNKNVSAAKRMVIVDGNNVAYGHSLNKEFSVKGLEICINYFKRMGHEVKAVVPQNRLKKTKSSNPLLLQKLHSDGLIVLTPCKNLPGKSSVSYDDRFILQLAAELDAAVISNDNYRDLFNENETLKTVIENRVIGYTWCNDIFILPKDPYGRFGPSLQAILNRIID